MKSILLITVLFCFLSLFSQNSQMLFTYTDSLEFNKPLLLPDEITSIPDNMLIEICLPAVPGVINFNKDFHGEELNNPRNSFNFNGEKLHVWDQDRELFGAGYFYFDYTFVCIDPISEIEEPVINCSEKLYLRIYNSFDLNSATHYRESNLILTPKPGSLPVDHEISEWSEWIKIKK